MTQIEQTYRALQIAAERIGRNNFANGTYRVVRSNERIVGGRYSITAEHKAVIEAMPRVLDGHMTPDEAMALLHQYDVLKQRLGSK